MALTKVQSAMLQSGSSGSGTGKNYLSTYNGNTGNGDFEQGTTNGWALFNTTLTGVLPTGSITAGAASFSTFGVTTTNPLGATTSLNTAGTYTAGQGFISSAFNIDIEDQAKVLSFQFSYQVQSGLSNGSFGGNSSNTFAVYIYDVTNSAWIQPAGVYNLVQGSGVGRATGTFQTTSNSTQYCIAVLCINTASGSISMLWDDFQVGPQISVNAPAMSDWKSYTASLAYGGTTATNITSQTYFYKRDGDSISLRGQIVFNGGANASGAYYFPLPPGLIIDATKLQDIYARLDGVATYYKSSGAVLYGTGALQADGHFNGGGNNYITAQAEAPTGTTGTWTASTTAGSNIPTGVAIASGDVIDFAVDLIPVSGWSSNTVMSNDTDTRVVALSNLGVTPTGSINASFNTVIFPLGASATDTHAAYNASTGTYTCPVSGFYNISAFVYCSISGTYSNTLIVLKKNGLTVLDGTNVTPPTTASVVTPLLSGVVYCNAGDALTIAITSNQSVITYATSQSALSINRLSGPAVIAATESVNMAYTSSTTTSVGTSTTVVVYDTKVYDSHNAFSTSTHLYTTPISGKYKVNANFLGGSAGYAATTWQQLEIHQNGAPIYKSRVYPNGSTIFLFGSINGTLNCNAGDTIGIYVVLATGAVTSQPDPTFTNLFIERVGN